MKLCDLIYMPRCILCSVGQFQESNSQFFTMLVPSRILTFERRDTSQIKHKTN
jgi:hypothetical protein